MVFPISDSSLKVSHFTASSKMAIEFLLAELTVFSLALARAFSALSEIDSTGSPGLFTDMPAEIVI